MSRYDTSPKAVCIGGGTGTPVSIRALRQAGIYTDAIVAVADDGGSSGLLRSHTGYVPPGDLRKCLVALAADESSIWPVAFKQRFEYAHNHTLGNLVITALQESSGDLQQAVSLCEQLLGCVGHVYPAALSSVVIDGITLDGVTLSGQSNICKSKTALASVSLSPANIRANPPAVFAITQADLLVLGPGSLFTSVIANLLIDDIVQAIKASNALKVFVCSLTDIQGETWGLDAAELTEAVLKHGLAEYLDYVIVNRPPEAAHPTVGGNVTGVFTAISSDSLPESGTLKTTLPSVRYVDFDQDIERRIRSSGVKLVVRDLIDPKRPTWHSSGALGEALASILQDSNRLSR
ncbi:MAG: YvcK family protein [Coriobacteriales bacterium]|jgi:uncharacterized cofD-like protein|nr:YvcK family protein [Coriobacteriales bacterium]